jgi:type I restriction enzyme S subunit
MSHYKPYPAYKDSGVEWIGRVPAHWEVKPICRIASCNDDSLPENVEPDQVLRYVDIASVNHRDGITGVAEIRFADAPSRARRKAKTGDVVISTVRTYLKAVAAVAEPYADCTFSTGFAVLRPRLSKLEPKFLKWLALNDLVIQAIESHSEGLSYPAINATELVKLKVVIPPPAEQTAIAAALDRETARIDALIAKKTRFIELLKEKRQALITHAVTKGLDPKVKMKDSGVAWIGEVPEHWRVERLAAFYREAIRPGDAALPVLSISIHDGISDDELSPDERERQVFHIEDRTKYKRVRPNDLAYNMMRAWQGAFGAVQVDGLVSPAYVVAEAQDDTRSAYIEQLLRTPMAVEEMRRFSRGIADFRMRLYWEYFRDLKVCVPPVSEQDHILSALEKATTRIDTLTGKTEHSIALLKERRSALITAAVTGQIDLREEAA